VRYAIKAAATDAKKGPTFPTLGDAPNAQTDATYAQVQTVVMNANRKGPTFPTLGDVCNVDMDVTFVNHLINVINVMQLMTYQTEYAQKDPKNAFALNTWAQTVEVMPANRVANKLG